MSVRGAVAKQLRRFAIGGSRRVVVTECQHCGLTVEQSPEACPRCDSDAFVAYEFLA